MPHCHNIPVALNPQRKGSQAPNLCAKFHQNRMTTVTIEVTKDRHSAIVMGQIINILPYLITNYIHITDHHYLIIRK